MKIFKLITFALLAITIQLSIFAQETPIGKKLHDEFWVALEKERYVAAQTKLDSLKRREPNFDASKMEKALNDATNKREKERQDSKAALQAKVNSSNNLDDLFIRRNIQADSFVTLEKIKADIAEFAKKTEDVLSADRSELSYDLEKSLMSVKRDIPSDAEKNAELVKRSNNSIEPAHAETAYYELLLRQAYWDNARKIFPDEADISKAYSSITASINALGTPEQRAANAEKNMKAKIDAERLPTARVKDANLEKLMQNAFNNQVSARNLQYSFIKVVITTNDYGLVRHDITGIILGRYRLGAIAYKDKDGKCKNVSYRIYQDYIGGQFSGTFRGDFSGFSAEMRCENVK